jgi:hypothetical protein
MAEKDMRRLYEPPLARDLSGFGVSGEGPGPLGACKPGTSPFYNCLVGPDFLGQCIPGTTPDTSACTPGGYHTYPACRPGANAATVCLSGLGQV